VPSRDSFWLISNAHPFIECLPSTGHVQPNQES
jgi:hypothetical protein